MLNPTLNSFYYVLIIQTRFCVHGMNYFSIKFEGILLNNLFSLLKRRLCGEMSRGGKVFGKPIHGSGFKIK